MTARLLTILALALPLTACAAQQTEPGPAAHAPAAAAPAVAPAPAAVQSDTAQQASSTQHDGAAAAAPRRADAGGTRGGNRVAAPATPAPATPATARATAPAPSAAPASPAPATTEPAAPAAGPAPSAAPDVAAPRPATPGVTVPTVTMPAGSSTGSLLQTLFALIVVLAVLGALAWFLKRYAPKVGGGNANMRVVGALNLGGRERIVVVEIGNEWIVVGASPGRINALATMPRQAGPNDDDGGANAALAAHSPAAHSFADWLKQTIDKRK
ncbi:flagellar biosynthetic protein FliO [Massilia rhizosphaerae]|uniref:flagellar biosynthetic protein FliO n=1 Tax=Massilia rhizosphaerae TaxID=2784389 RepID=UPI0018DB76B2|nr:flagellar biosynthetic protein FliO [Massilia rhizosphaerae]